MVKWFIRSFVVCALLYYSELALSQPKKVVDSVSRLMNSEAGKQLSPDAQMRNLIFIANAISFSNFDTAFLYSQRALDLSRELGNKRGEAMSLTAFGVIFENQSRHDSALAYYHHAQRILYEIKDTLGIIHTNNNIGIVVNNMGNYKETVRYYTMALELAQQIKNNELTSYALNNLAIVYYDWQQYPIALEYYDQALTLLREMGVPLKIAVLLNNIGELYLEIGKQDEAQDNFAEALSICLENGKTRTLINSYLNLGGVQLLKKNYANAEFNFDKAYEYATEKEYPSGIVDAKIKLAETKLETSRLNEAYLDATEGLKLALQLKNQKQIKEAHFVLYQIFAQKGSYKEAIDQYLAYSTAKDTIFNQNSRKDITRLRTEYETEKKEKEIILLNQEKVLQQLAINRQKSLFWLTLSSALIVLLVIYLIFNHHRLKQKGIKAGLERQKIEIEQRLLRSQMSPHFIFNSLNSINSFIASNNVASAQNFLRKFSDLIRLILENSRKSMIPFADELKTLELNLELEQIRFNHSFRFELIADDDIDPENTYVPPMLVQPFVENALIHGILPKKAEGIIRLEFHLNDSMLHVVVQDNGIGRRASGSGKTAQASKHKSLGLQLTHERLTLLSDKTGRQFRYEITDLYYQTEEAAGTRIDIFMPCESE